VIIPAQNIDDLMLCEEVMAAVRNKSFLIISVDSIGEAMEILCGHSWENENRSIKSRALAMLQHFNRLRFQNNSDLSSDVPFISGEKILADKDPCSAV
jgi:predicted ATP-dependent protease